MQKLVLSTGFVQGVELVIGSKEGEEIKESVGGGGLECTGGRSRRRSICTQVIEL